MKLFNNPEIKNFTVIYSFVSVAFSLICLFFSPVFSAVLLIFSAFSLLLFLLFTKKRYRKINELTDTIDKILQGKDFLVIKAMKEGELSILETQLEKMFIRLSEQRDLLKKEKLFLADSIADLSHQLRTPLTSINLILTLLADEGISDEKRTELLRELSSHIDGIQNLVTTLLKISKLDAGTTKLNFRKISVDELIINAAKPMLILIDLKNITFEVNTHDTFINGDLLWLTEAFSNIIKNAVEHTPENGKLRISATDNPLYTEILICDSGKGFEEEDIPHIFERFYKGKNAAKDSFGIGLNLAKTVIVNSFGTIKASNGENGGAVFTVKFYKNDKTVT